MTHTPGNPYTMMDYTPDPLCRMRAWEEGCVFGEAKGYHSRDAVVADLLEALERLLQIRHNHVRWIDEHNHESDGEHAIIDHALKKARAES